MSFIYTSEAKMLRKLLNLTFNLVLLIPAAFSDVINIKRPKNDITLNSKAGSLMIRPDGSDTTLLCFKHLGVPPQAFRVLDLAGEDQYEAPNVQALVGVGNELHLPACETQKEGETYSMSRSQFRKCVDEIAKKAPNINGKIVAQQVDYQEECEGPAKPKEAAKVKRKRSR